MSETDSERPPRSLSRLAEGLQSCHRCQLYRHATQGVPGQGPRKAALILVGEQPGNDEDIVGKPFVGPAGRMLDRALTDSGIDRKGVFVTNAVKHFKFEPRGKKRLHKRPDAYEIERCRWWLESEIRLIRPALIVAMGATAARSVFGRSVTISHVRGEVRETRDGLQALVTIHPSYLLRIPDARDKAAAYDAFVRDLEAARRYAL